MTEVPAGLNRWMHWPWDVMLRGMKTNAGNAERQTSTPTETYYLWADPSKASCEWWSAGGRELWEELAVRADVERRSEQELFTANTSAGASFVSRALVIPGWAERPLLVAIDVPEEPSLPHVSRRALTPGRIGAGKVKKR